jgi:hypothetical protein
MGMKHGELTRNNDDDDDIHIYINMRYIGFAPNTANKKGGQLGSKESTSRLCDTTCP